MAVRPIPDPILPPNEGNNLNLQENIQLGIQLEFGDQNVPQDPIQCECRMSFKDLIQCECMSLSYEQVKENIKLLMFPPW